MLRFLAFAVIGAAGVSATIGAALQVAAGIPSPSGVPLIWFTWFVGDGLGIIVLLPLCLMFSPGQREQWRGRRWMVAIPSLIMLTAITGGIMINAGLVQQQRDAQIAREADDAAAALVNEIALHKELLRGVTSHHAVTPFTKVQDFATLTESFLAAHPEIQAVSWNPIVPAADLASFVSAQRQATGDPGYDVWQRSAAGDRQPVRDRSRYVPVAFIEPLASNAPALGFDVNSDAIRAEAISRSLATGLPQLTAPIDLVQGSREETGALLFYPTINSDGSTDGFAVGVYRVNGLLGQTLDRGRWREWNFELTDVTPGQDPTVLAQRRVDAGDAAIPEAATAEPIAVGGRLWSLTAWPSAAALRDQAPVTSPLLLLAGLIIAFLLESFLLLLTGMEGRARREAEASHFESVHDELTGLLNRRGFFESLAAVRQRVADQQGSAVLMFGDLDGFKGVNDTLGHEAGDDLLRRVGTVLSGAVRERDVVARLGGDEFALIATDCDLDHAHRIAAAIRRQVSGLGIGMSLGLVPMAGSDVPLPDALMRAADAACYEAKHAGGATVRAASTR